jgi:hypothetical protein
MTWIAVERTHGQLSSPERSAHGGAFASPARATDDERTGAAEAHALSGGEAMAVL